MDDFLEIYTKIGEAITARILKEVTEEKEDTTLVPQRLLTLIECLERWRLQIRVIKSSTPQN